MMVLVTGGSRGIGQAICREYATRGHEVLAPTRAQLDLSSGSSVAAFVAQYRKVSIDVIINNAGINPLSLLEEIKDADIEACFQTNLVAPLQLVRGLVGTMKAAGKGYVVNIGSVWGVVSKEKRTVYSITKNGVHGLTTTMAVELGPYGILVNTVCPGFTKTELTAQNVSPADEAELTSQVPLGRFAQPEEIAKLVYFLGSEENTYVTGQKIVIDGGFTVK